MGLLTQMSGCALHDNKTRRDRIRGGHFRPTEVTVTFPCDSQECRNPCQPPRASTQAMRDKNIPPCHMTQVRLLWYCPQCADRQRSQYQQNHSCIQTGELCELTHAPPTCHHACDAVQTSQNKGFPKSSRVLEAVQSAQANAIATMPSNTIHEASRRGSNGRSANNNVPMSAAMITDVSRSAETSATGAIVLA